uniref:MICOS complex subunit n=1 Tax=Electrophorus electricus TaxID=8005 RepID=A0AAY5EZL8_ELEEL
QFVKVVAVPAVLGIASIRVYAVNETNTEGLLSPRELLKCGFLFIQGAFVSVKVMAVNLYHGGEDIYHFLKDPPSGFAPRVAVITVSGLAGVILARKGSRLKRLILPLSLTMAGFAMCYPIQTIAILKVGGKNIYAASQWTSETVASLWRSDTTVVVVPANLEVQHSPTNTYTVHLNTPTTPPADDDILLMTAEGKATCPSSSLTTKSQPVLPSLQSSGDITNATGSPPKH